MSDNNDANNTYLLDPESQGEMLRLARQGRILTQQLGLLPPNINPLHLPSVEAGGHPPVVLDIGCATGEWPLALAAAYQPIEVIGIDISQLMTAYATEQAENQEVQGVQFLRCNALERLPFPDEHFDLINLRVAVGFIPRSRWEDVVRECWRLLRPQGFFISTEGEAGVTTFQNPATARISHWLVQALWNSGLGFWDAYSTAYGIHAMQPVIMNKAGFKDLRFFPYFNYASFGSPGYQAWLDHLKITVQAIKSLVHNTLGVPEEEFNQTLEESLLEARQDTYQLYTSFLAVTGQKVV